MYTCHAEEKAKAGGRLVILIKSAPELWPSSVWQKNKMSQSQYIKMLERELNKVNQMIDLKILQGRDYSKEARDHKLILKKIRYNTKRSLWDKFRLFRPLALKF